MVSPEVAERVNEIAMRWHVSANVVIAKLLDFYENAQLDRGAMPQRESSESLAPEVTASQQYPVQWATEPMGDLASAIKETRLSVLWLIEPVYQALDIIRTVYPDLRAELATVLDTLAERANSLLEAWAEPAPPLESLEPESAISEEGSADEEEAANPDDPNLLSR